MRLSTPLDSAMLTEVGRRKPGQDAIAVIHSSYSNLQHFVHHLFVAVMADDSSVKISVKSPDNTSDSPVSHTPKSDISRSEAEAKSGGIVKRALSKTSDKLSRRVSSDGKSLSQSQVGLSGKSHRNLFSLHRSKSNLKDVTGEGGTQFYFQLLMTTACS